MAARVARSWPTVTRQRQFRDLRHDQHHTTADDTTTLVCDGTNGYGVARSAN